MNSVIQVEGLVKRFGADHARSTASTSPSAAAPCSACSGRTARARPPPCACSPPCCAPTRDAPACSATTSSPTPEAVRARIGLTGQYAAVDEALSGTDNLVLVARLLDLPRREARPAPPSCSRRFGLADAAGPARAHLLRRHAPPARPGREPRRPPGRAVPRRADHRAGPAAPQRGLGRGPRRSPPTATTVLLTTQYLEEAEQLADDLVVLDHGRVIAAGTPAALKAEVGGQRLHVRPLRPADLPAVTALVAGLVPGAAPAADAAGELTVAVPDPAAAGPGGRPAGRRRPPRRRAGAAAAVLDDVFLTLTGRAATDAAEEAA